MCSGYHCSGRQDQDVWKEHSRKEQNIKGDKDWLLNIIGVLVPAEAGGT